MTPKDELELMLQTDAFSYAWTIRDILKIRAKGWETRMKMKLGDHQLEHDLKRRGRDMLHRG